MNQTQIAHTSGWVAFVALSVSLVSGLVMVLPYRVKRKHSLGWHRGWTIIAATLVAVHVAAQVDISRFDTPTVIGWVALSSIGLASTHRKLWIGHRRIGEVAYLLAAIHVVWLFHRGDVATVGVLALLGVGLWFWAQRHTPAPVESGRKAKQARDDLYGRAAPPLPPPHG